MAGAGYGLWPLVILDTGLFVVFAVSLVHPKTERDWPVMGGFSTFMVALFTEVYGAPLTVYLLGSWLGSRFPLLEDTHAGGYVWNDLTGWIGDPHLSPFHLASYLFIGGGFWLVAAAWPVLFAAARSDHLATAGPYVSVRHPQIGLLLVIIGLLLPAKAEAREVAARFGDSWRSYAAATPGFVPRRRPRTVEHNRQPSRRPR